VKDHKEIRLATGDAAIWVSCLRGLSMKAHGLAYAISSHMPKCKASFKTLMAETGMSESTLRRALRELEAKGVVEAVPFAGLNGTYRLYFRWDAGTSKNNKVQFAPRQGYEFPMGIAQNSHGEKQEIPWESNPANLTNSPRLPDAKANQIDAEDGQSDTQTRNNKKEQEINKKNIGVSSGNAEADRGRSGKGNTVEEVEPYNVNFDPRYLALLDDPYGAS
jgi:DNA-binding transcriptional ArsR family regulator